MALKAEEHVKYYHNQNGPTIGTTCQRVIEKDGLYFKDLDGSGELKSYDDWRLPSKERAEAYVKVLTTEEKIAQLFISDWRMGKYPVTGSMAAMAPEEVVLDESGVLDEAEFRGKTRTVSSGDDDAFKRVVFQTFDPAGKCDGGRYDRLAQPASGGCGRVSALGSGERGIQLTK